MVIVSSVTLGYRCIGIRYFVGIIIYSKFRREVFELVKKRKLYFEDLFWDFVSDCVKSILK